MRKFALRVTNAAVAEETAGKGRDEELVPAHQQLARAISDTRAADAARAALDGLLDRQLKDTRPAASQRELERARDRWQELTGRRPPD
ncbi:hypothetical protein [Streptomyces uncialis]|uniref:hypothetical protein n=1 Tax=Streptomyces uncialis TaxID=1048205 RepID=UPI003789EC26